MTERKHTKDNRDDVATLIRLAGPRPAVPSERLERARAAAQSVWRQELAHRARRRYRWTVAALATAAVLVLMVRLVPFGDIFSPEVHAAITVESLVGSSWIRDAADQAGSERQALGTGDTVPLGSELGTAEAGRVAVRMASGHSVRADLSTRIRILDGRSVALDQGAIYVDSGPRPNADETLIVHTPLGVVREIGTQFAVRLKDGGSVRVRVREGAVTLAHGDVVHEISVENELELDGEGRAVTRAIARDDPSWDWIASVAPMIDLEGRTAREFLDWVARERGWTLAFADRSVARSAEETVVAGTVSGMSIEQALAAVLPSCRLVHRLADGVLVIDALPGD